MKFIFSQFYYYILEKTMQYIYVLIQMGKNKNIRNIGIQVYLTHCKKIKI